VELPEHFESAKHLLAFHAYTRVINDKNQLVDHLQLESAWRGKDERLSIWDIRLSAPLILATHLRGAGFTVQIINSITADTADQSLAAIEEFDPCIIVLCSTFILSSSQFLDVSLRLRERFPACAIVAGGQHVFTQLMRKSAEERAAYLADSELDAFICDPQGEAALVTFCRAVANGRDLRDLAAIPNLIYRHADGTTTHGPAIPENNEMNLSGPDLHEVEPNQVIHIRTARSCSFKCAFCTYPSIAGPLALMDVDAAMVVLRRARDCRVSAVVFTDDTFNVPPERFESLLDSMIAEKLGLTWYSFLRCQYLTEPLVRKMVASGCAGVFLGVESGSDAILRNMKKGAVARFYRDGIRWLKEAGILTMGAFVVGFPGETSETVEETRIFIEKSGLDYYLLQPFFYLHHAPINDRAAEFDLGGQGLFWSHKTMNWRQANDHINRLFLDIRNSTFIHPDYNLWEYVYLRSRGLSDDEFRAYRLRINDMTRTQLLDYDLIRAVDGEMAVGITSRRT
jgi:p-methyltransferase